MGPIPSISALRAFESAARHLSFQQAADELNVTPGAVSRQIQTLEAALATPLFQRHHKRVELTRAGLEYLAEVRTPLARIVAATARLQGHTAGGILSICAYPTFAIRWFIPRWGRFYDRHPDIEVRLTTSLTPVDFARDDYDLAIQVLGDGDSLPGIDSHRIVGVDTFPVCTPAMAKRLKTPADLAQVTLLHGDPRPRDWARWLEAAGIDDPAVVDPEPGLRFESLNLAIQAAIEGLGVAIGIEALVRDDLEQGRLVRPFPTTRRSRRSMHLVYPHARADSPKITAFRDWLLSEAAD